MLFRSDPEVAEDTQLDNFRVAIKMLPAILVANKRALKQLKAEALVSMKLVHSNIVPLRGFEENNGNPFLVMDYIDGQTLDDLLAEKEKLTEEETIRVLAPIAAALDYAHGEGVVHRDVKPGNVIIRKDGRPFVLDFGIAREIQETMTRVTGKLSSGTLLYMSPEQNNGDEPTPAQDVYSFAAMAYECLAGKPPFTRGNIEYQIMNTPPAPLTGEAAILAAGVMAGLAKKPEDRPPTCAAVLEGSVFSRKERKERKEAGGSHPVDSQSGRGRSPSGPQGDENVRVGGRVALSAPIRTVEPSLVQVREIPPPANNQVETENVRKAVHNKVQLWEGGPYWADTNIGAKKPWKCGYYFWWGDTVGYKRKKEVWVASDGSSSGFSFYGENTPTCGKTIEDLKNGGWITASNVLTPEHDVAQVQWGGAWRMPTRQELEYLRDKCDWNWTTIHGVNGYIVRGRNGYASNSIFLPCAGYGYVTSLYTTGSYGGYWSSVPDSDYHGACCLFLSSDPYSRNLCYYRYYGQSVRPVQGFTN